jgi:hypothetical protein
MYPNGTLFFIDLSGSNQQYFKLALRIVTILILSLYAFNGVAQPALPNITGSAERGVVILTWNCQFDGIKTISVLRSTDSVSNYTTIGNVKNVYKGIQVFVDGHPGAGKNFYKLAIRFNSGLTWGSNHYGIYVPDSLLRTSAMPLPANDSIQQFIVTKQEPKRVTQIAPTTEPKTESAALNNISGKNGTSQILQTDKPALCDTQSLRRPTISVSFDTGTSRANVNTLPESSKVVAPRQKITISFDDTYENSATLIRSRFIFVDPVSGHVNMTLPDDVHTHHYSVKFYDQKNKMIVDVPRINAPAIIIDKRNFQRKGNYKFILRKDVTELEEGYINVNPNP